jgi:TM2 domain-containing membrane protein YozV
MSTPVVDPEQRPTPELPPAPARTVTPQLKSPGLAFFLSFLFPGIGQVYNGQPAKAMAFFAAFVAAFVALINWGPLPWVFFLPFVILYNLVDAWRTATLINAQGTGAAVSAEDMAESPAWGAGLMILGLLFLLQNLHWIDLARLGRYWPVLLIAAGAVIFYRSFQRKKEKDDAPAL